MRFVIRSSLDRFQPDSDTIDGSYALEHRSTAGLSQKTLQSLLCGRRRHASPPWMRSSLRRPSSAHSSLRANASFNGISTEFSPGSAGFTRAESQRNLWSDSEDCVLTWDPQTDADTREPRSSFFTTGWPPNLHFFGVILNEFECSRNVYFNVNFNFKRKTHKKKRDASAALEDLGDDDRAVRGNALLRAYKVSLTVVSLSLSLGRLSRV